MDAPPEPVVIEAPSPTQIGGYGQLDANYLRVGAGNPWEGSATVRRLVLFVSHDLSRWGLPIDTAVELEWENAIACDGCVGSVEVEQAVLRWRLAGDPLTLEAGLILVPMGATNLRHEPPVFNGVSRPETEELVIPSTWRELGVGLSGQSGALGYALYAMTPLDPEELGADGVRGGRTNGGLSPATAVALTGRIEVEPVLGTVVALSAYGSDAGPAGDWYDGTGERLDLLVPVLGSALDARWSWRGLGARGLAVGWSMPESDDLMEARRADGSLYHPEGGPVVPSALWGAYGEVSYNLLYQTDSSQSLSAFARLEAYDLQARVPEGYEADPALSVHLGTFGLTYKPIQQVAFKADVQLRDRRYGLDELAVNAGLGWMF